MANVTAGVACLLLARFAAAAPDPAFAWMTHVRIGAYGADGAQAAAIVRDALATGVNAIEVDNDPPGRYDSFLGPAAKLADLKVLAAAAHAAGLRIFAYAAGFECITPAAPTAPHTLFKDHPDWVQRDRNRRPAVFGHGAAFWIAAGDEDVWVTPFAPAWRARYLDLVGAMAATGLDGVYVDIPYWMTHFDGWEESWASFDDATVAAFRARTGLDARRDVKLGDFRDPGFLAWTRFRMDAVTEFMAEVRDRVRRANPACATIAEIYPEFGDGAVRVGADVARLYGVLDGIAHECQVGGENAAGMGEDDWFGYVADFLVDRALAAGKATWALSYSWDGETTAQPADAMRTLLLTEAACGAGVWDAKGHEMAESNDPATRTAVFDWIARHEDRLYGARTPEPGVVVPFDRDARDQDPEGYGNRIRAAVVAGLRAGRGVLVVSGTAVAEAAAGPRWVNASPHVAVLAERIGGNPQVTLLNFQGLRRGGPVTPVAETGITVSLPAAPGATLRYLPFLGEERILPARRRDGRLEARLPPVARGAVVRVEPVH